MSVLNTRSTLLCLSLIVVLFAPASSGAQALSAFSKQKAERLLKDHLPCLGCHKLNGEGGTIGPDLTTVRERRSPAYIAAMISDPQRVVPGSAMPLILMPESTRRLIIQYLGERPGSASDDGAAGSRPTTPLRPASPTTPDGPA